MPTKKKKKRNDQIDIYPFIIIGYIIRIKV